MLRFEESRSGRKTANLAGLRVGEDELAERAEVLNRLVAIRLKVVLANGRVHIDLGLLL